MAGKMKEAFEERARIWVEDDEDGGFSK